MGYWAVTYFPFLSQEHYASAAAKAARATKAPSPVGVKAAHVESFSREGGSGTHRGRACAGWWRDSGARGAVARYPGPARQPSRSRAQVAERVATPGWSATTEPSPSGYLGAFLYLSLIDPAPLFALRLGAGSGSAEQPGTSLRRDVVATASRCAQGCRFARIPGVSLREATRRISMQSTAIGMGGLRDHRFAVRSGV